MADSKSFAEKMMKPASQDVTAREGIKQERQQTGRAFDLEIRSADGRTDEAIAWALYQRRRWQDTGGAAERLILLFASGAVTIEGHNLRRLTELIREERLEVVQEHDAAEQKLIASENRGLDPLHRKAIITRVNVEPDFDIAFMETITIREEGPDGPEYAG